jgi:hypothetical protein
LQAQREYARAIWLLYVLLQVIQVIPGAMGKRQIAL